MNRILKWLKIFLFEPRDIDAALRFLHGKNLSSFADYKFGVPTFWWTEEFGLMVDKYNREENIINKAQENFRNEVA